MAYRLYEGSEVVATSNVHVPYSDTQRDITKFMSVIKGEVLNVIKVVDESRVIVENTHGIQGYVSPSSVHPTDIYHHEDFYLCDFTTTMVETVLLNQPPGTFIVRSNSRDAEKLVISVKFQLVRHYSFQKKDGGVDYDGVHYKSVPNFVNKCTCEKILEGRLGHWIKQSDINVPQNNKDGAITKTVMNLRIVGKNQESN